MKKESLFELAERKKLPLHQFIDGETVKWVIKNKPKFGKTGELKLPSRKILKRFIPDNSWFLQAKEIDSIHGMRHILRVAVNAILIVKKYFYEKRIENLIIAAVIHDIRRKNDKDDFKHGLRSANWFRENATLVGKKFNVEFRDEDIKEIYWLIFSHELPRADLKENKNYCRFRRGIDIIRIADALDRYRLPKTKWWINEEIIGLVIPDIFKKSAFNLIIKSELNFLKGKNSQESVLNVLK
ncbi:hypothetical protein COS23_01960 [bacterium (Candidatus Moisslbacteria) CG02_land_8_20_14_3_00_36_53]|nr:MAG: hypothetical protein AUK09_00820 [Parcubacteria group bacterium CG2_30_36_38]PIV45914.1 MAG: hypothetical protein COS23_01960 [bacterium (Candidatus Moisslbacteria) CG02_land_8_20_14_3_00_36_53]PIZ90167.1 MAG: hypothetical protein COX87_01965 [bacterium (Candidatus Moisslbacteria) CG_4_10_14_0_2_um_filter_36_61]PJC00644.1 MAG: hypothetical protein CO074_01175 [bacterium (Candidatus Moisslbacteria) CG_4_9_14_0_8_um_filter_36_20]